MNIPSLWVCLEEVGYAEVALGKIISR